MAKVPVYPYRPYDITTDDRPVESQMATREWIESRGHKGVWNRPLEVDESEIDSDGYYHPRR
jgi:hypothetical protein